MKPFDWSPDLRGSVLDVLELQEELVGVLVRPAAVLAPVVAPVAPSLWPAGELGVEALERADLLLDELDFALADRLLQPQQSLVAGLEAVADPHASHPSRTDLEPPEHQLVGHSLGPVGGMLERMGQDRLLDRRRDAVGVRSLRARQPVEQPLGAVHLKVAADLVEMLPAVAQDPARLRDVAEFLSEL